VDAAFGDQKSERLRVGFQNGGGLRGVQRLNLAPASLAVNPDHGLREVEFATARGGDFDCALTLHRNVPV
jgi:hypothetical protein